MNLIGLSSTELLQYLNTLRDLVTELDLQVMSRNATWVFNTYATFEVHTSYRSRVSTTTIFHWRQLKVPIITFFAAMGSNFIFLTPKKALHWWNDVWWYIVLGDVSKYATCARDKQNKKEHKYSCVKLAICPDQPRRHSPPLNFASRVVSGSWVSE